MGLDESWVGMTGMEMEKGRTGEKGECEGWVYSMSFLLLGNVGFSIIVEEVYNAYRRRLPPLRKTIVNCNIAKYRCS